MNEKTVRTRLMDEKRSILAQMGATGQHLFAGDPVEYSLAIQMQSRLERIEAALQRLENGRYGFCTACHHPIHADRLSSIPEAELCLGCQSRLESRHNRLALPLAA